MQNSNSRTGSDTRTTPRCVEARYLFHFSSAPGETRPFVVIANTNGKDLVLAIDLRSEDGVVEAISPAFLEAMIEAIKHVRGVLTAGDLVEQVE